MPPNPPDKNDLTGSTVDLVSCLRFSSSEDPSDIVLAIVDSKCGRRR